MRDPQRSKVYAAEDDVFGDPDDESRPNLGSVADTQRFVDRLLALERVRAEFGDWQIEVRDGRGRRRGGAGHRLGGDFVTLPKFARTPEYVLHEVAHLLTGCGHQHGPAFTGTMLLLVGQVFGAEWRDRLKRAYRKHGAKIRYRDG